MERLEGRSYTTTKELQGIARELEIPYKRARKWAVESQKPVALTRIEDALKNKHIGKNIRLRLGALDSPEKVRVELANLGFDKLIKPWKQNDDEWKRLELYFQFVACLEQGTLVKDISRLVGVARSTVYYWTGMHFPYPLFLLLEEGSGRHRVLTKEHEIQVFVPRIYGNKIAGVNELRNLIAEHLPRLLSEPEISGFIDEARNHISLTNEVAQRTQIGANDLRTISERLKIPYSTARRWTLDAGRPEVYVYVQRGLENKTAARALRGALPFKSMGKVRTVLAHSFLQPSLLTWDNFGNLERMTHAYYKFLDMFERGYTQSTIASKIGVGERTIYDWLQGRLPLLLHMLREMPTETPHNAKCWLPVFMEGRVFKNYIQVPRVITHFDELQEVIAQLQDDSIQIEDFMYVLGVLVSDGYVEKRGKTSSSFRLLLSTNYSWSDRLIKATSETLEALGFAVSILEDSNEERERIEMRSHTTPFFLWVRSAVLGLGSSEIKTYTPVEGSWILEAPEASRLAFLQGLADGDGSASLYQQQAKIASISNEELICRLLKSLGIESTRVKEGVCINRKQSILRAASLPIFRHAETRLSNLSMTAQMIHSQSERQRFSEVEVRRILDLRRRDWSYGRIALQLWREYGISRSPSSIGNFLRRRKSEQV